jgi:Cu(I)/Ag(I) efflux system membrane fusion protein
VQNLGIRSVEVTRGALGRQVEAVGSVAFDERAVVLVQAKVAGYIEKLWVRAPLDVVRQGQPLAEILAPEWVAAQEEYLSLLRSAQANDALRQAARQRLLLLGMSESTIAAITLDGKTRPRITLFAPASGVIGELGVREGMSVAAGAMLFRINGLAHVWINAEVPESQAAWIKAGAAATAKVTAWPGESFKARVEALLPEVNTITRTLKVRLDVPNPGGKLKPGMFATVAFAPLAAAEVLLVPSEAVIATGTRSVVVIADRAADGSQYFRSVDVELGAESGGMSEIRKGLTFGQKVVLSGQFLIDSEASLKSSNQRMAGDAPPARANSDVVIHHGEGRIERIGSGTLTISHGAIASLHMGAMTMEYAAPSAALLPGIREGSQIRFDLRRNAGGDLQLENVQPLGPAGTRR